MAARTPDISRRRLLKAGLGATALFLPVPYAWVWAQSEGAMKLLRLPKIALVLGNSRSASVPALINPGNDARAISDLLRQSGFDVAAKLDATLDDMTTAIRSYVQTLAAKKAVGLFYFAGHGVQLSWRNYLVPVDAVVRRPEDIPNTCIDLTSLMEGITKASNPMNVVILDACRENPFSAETRGEGRTLTVKDAPVSTPGTAQKDAVGRAARGLSQMDAPHSTLLAYATAPGNVASDGEGANGLYTENLLREMRVPEAKLEDVFKRVRLDVRRRTNGQQIPWESTSLEEDFYFIPPKALSTRADEAAERERKQEMALREKRRAEEEAERKRKQEQVLREAKLAAEAAERKRQQELVLLEQQRITEEAERKRKQELALKEAQRVSEAAERQRLEAQALKDAKAAEEEAARKHQQELALREQRRVEEEAQRKRKEEQVLREAKLAEEAAARKYQQEIALREKQLAQEETERRRKQEPVPIRKPDADVVERQFQEELVLWEKIKASKEAAPLEGYLLRYPSGRFSELAQFQLDRVLAAQGEKKIEVVSDERNPYSKGSARADTHYKIGDRYAYREIDTITGLENRRYTRTVTKITEDEVIFGNGDNVIDLLGNPLQEDQSSWKGCQLVPLEFSVGRRWHTRFLHVESTGTRSTVELAMHIIARERITVPGGSFNTFRVEAQGWRVGMRDVAFPSSPSRSLVRINSTWNLTGWYAPEVLRHFIAREYAERWRGGAYISAGRSELTDFRQS